MHRTVALGACALLLAACSERPRAAPDRPAPADPARSPAGGAPTPSDAAPVVPSHPAWSIVRIGPDERAALVPRNWRPGCPVALEDLRWLTVRYLGFDGEVRTGPLVLHARVVQDVRWVFRQLFLAGFQIKHVALPRRYHPNPDRRDEREAYRRTRSVTAAFNCRPVTDVRGVWSQHAYGWAVDVNPLQNPYVRSDGSVLRRAAKPYRDRSLDEPGMIQARDVVVRSFAAVGWEWGGDWRTLKDYMHFALTGR